MPVGVHTHRERWHCLLSQPVNKIGMLNQRGPNGSTVTGILMQLFMTYLRVLFVQSGAGAP